MSAIKYSFNSKEMNNWKARISERLVQHYIKDILIPSIKKEGWDIVIYSRTTWCSVPDSKGFNPKISNEMLFFLSNRLLPTSKLLKHFNKLTATLENSPDGFLIKLRKTGESKKLIDAMNNSMKVVRYCGCGEWHFNVEEHDWDELLPMVDGEVEVVEVKADRSILPPHQKRMYCNILKEGYILRFFHVNIVSFEKNMFEIEQKITTKSNELRTFPLRKENSPNL